MNKTLSLILVSCAFFLLFSPALFGQVSQYVIEVKVPAAVEKTPLVFSVQLAQNIQIRRVVLHYREFGASEFKEIEMLLSGRTAAATLPAQVILPPYIEYYIGLQLANNSRASFPAETPEMNPLKVQVKETDLKDLEVRFLSPEPGETVTAEDLVVAVSLMYVSDAVDAGRTKLYFDGLDVTDEAVITDDVILYNPKNFDRPLQLGAHSISVELHDTLGNSYYTKQSPFNLSTAIAIEEQKSMLQYSGNAQAEVRNEKVGGVSTSYIRGDAQIGGTYQEFLFNADLHVTNEEKSSLQPQNRYHAAFQAGDYAKIQVGDAYPQFPSLLVSGKRVRGISGTVTLGNFNLDISYGQTLRAVEGNLKEMVPFADSNTALGDSRDKVYLHTNPADSSVVYQLYDRGTYNRNFLAIRPSLTIGENFIFGLTYLKSKDDKGSITYGKNPKENFVAGTDLLLAFDNQRVRWASQAAMSFENNDIGPGDYSDADIEEYKGVGDPEKDQATARREADELKNVAKLVRKFITFNSSLSPLNPWNKMPSLAYESELSLHYFDNYVRAMVFRRGVAYVSYGNDFIQNDISGFNISDRIRLLDNRILTGISYETKKNNTMNDGSAPTTTYNTFSTSVTAYPGAEYPSFTLGYGFNTRSNSIDATTDTLRVDSLGVADDRTNRYFLSANYDFELLVRNTVTAAVSYADKKDRTFYKRDIENVNASILFTSYFSIPLQTTCGFILSHTAAYAARQDTAGTFTGAVEKNSFAYQTLTLGMRYRLLEDRMTLLASMAPSFGDFKRLLLQAGIEYQIAENHFVASQFDFTKYPDSGNDTIVSLLYRYMF